MALGGDLYKVFQAKANAITGTINEKALFSALNESIEALASLSAVNSEVIHGNKSLVKFSETSSAPFFYSKDSGKTVKCELADLLIISVNDIEMRICCLQNKYEKGITAGMTVADSYYADMRQYYLLNKRPEYIINGTSSTLLSEAICPSVGAYGVFYKNGTDYDMNYHSAYVLQELTPGATSRRRKVELGKSAPQFTKRCRGSYSYDECQFAGGITEFGDEVERMHIGTPFNIISGLRALGDPDLVDAVIRVAELPDSYRQEVYSADSTSENVGVSYRCAWVIRGE